MKSFQIIIKNYLLHLLKNTVWMIESPLSYNTSLSLFEIKRSLFRAPGMLNRLFSRRGVSLHSRRRQLELHSIIDNTSRDLLSCSRYGQRVHDRPNNHSIPDACHCCVRLIPMCTLKDPLPIQVSGIGIIVGRTDHSVVF